MDDAPQTRSVKISDDERGGWSSDRPRRAGGPARPPDVSVRSRILRPADRLRYSPGSLVVVVCADAGERERFLTRVIEDRDRGAVLSLARVRALLSGRVADDEIEGKAAEVLDGAVRTRLEAGETVVVAADGLGRDERERHVRVAAANRRPRHLILVEVGKDLVSDEDRLVVNELRRGLDAGELGEEGFQTVLRLGGTTAEELKRIVFRPPPRDD